MDFYDQPEPVSRSSSLAAEFFRRRLDGPVSDRSEIITAIQQVAASVDAKSWAALRQRFAPKLEIDYTSLGGEKATVDADQLVEDWRAYHQKFDSMRHVYYNFEVQLDGRRALVMHDGIATLTHGEKRWTVGGRYTVSLEKMGKDWKINKLAFEKKFEQGDR